VSSRLLIKTMLGLRLTSITLKRGWLIAISASLETINIIWGGSFIRIS
jgi:hypothetical protein